MFFLLLVDVSKKSKKRGGNNNAVKRADPSSVCKAYRQRKSESLR